MILKVCIPINIQIQLCQVTAWTISCNYNDRYNDNFNDPHNQLIGAVNEMNTLLIKKIDFMENVS